MTELVVLSQMRRDVWVGVGWRPGKDIAGTVVAEAADGGDGPAVGTRVVGHVRSAGWAQYAAAPAVALAPLPNELPATVAAALPLAGLTAVRLLRTAGSLVGKRLLLTGASGGVGHYVTELAVAAGAQVTAVCATEDRGARLRALGACTVTSVEEAERWFDVAMESVGGDTLAAVRRKVRPDGLTVWFGQASREPVKLDFFDWVQGTAGAPIVQFHYDRDDEENGAELATLVRLAAQDRLHPEIGSLRALARSRHDHRGPAPTQNPRQRRSGGPAMNQARDVLVQYLDALTDGDVERIRAKFSEDATWRLHGDLPLAGVREGRDEILDFLISAGALYAPGTQNFTFGEITAEGERAVLEWQVRGVSARTGLAYNNEYCGSLHGSGRQDRRGARISRHSVRGSGPVRYRADHHVRSTPSLL